MTSLPALEWLPSFLVPFFTLSYPAATPTVPDSFHDSTYYRTGPLDVCIVITFIAVMAVLRDATRLGLMVPFATWKLSRDLGLLKELKSNGKPVVTANGNGHAGHGNGSSTHSLKEARKIHRKVIRFAEQGWSVICYTMTWTFGLVCLFSFLIAKKKFNAHPPQYIHRNLPTEMFAPSALWLNYPHIPLAAPVKLYYLLQAASYLHQVLILNAEARRKDHVQMMTHHVITIALIGASYFTNFVRVGCLTLVLMDWCDILLPVSFYPRPNRHNGSL